MSAGVDLKQLYPDPLGGTYVGAIDVFVRQREFEGRLGASVEQLRKAAAELGGYEGRRELSDPYLRRWVAQVRDARAQAVAACDALLARLEEL